jgi:hypothetical protein
MAMHRVNCSLQAILDDKLSVIKPFLLIFFEPPPGGSGVHKCRMLMLSVNKVDESAS